MKQNKIITSIRGGLELKKDSNIMEGYAARFNEPSNLLFENGKTFIEIIHEEAVRSALSVSEDIDVIFNYNHDDNKMLARYNPAMGATTLTLDVRKEGLWISAELPDTENGREVLAHMRAKNLYGMSFVFWTNESSTSGDIKWKRGDDGVLIRNVMNIRKISDVSVVRRPAYETSSVNVYERAIKEADESIKTSRDIHKSRGLADVLDLQARLY